MRPRQNPERPVRPLPGEPDCAYCDNMRFLVDATGALQPCEHCGVARQRKVRSLESFSSRSGTALTQFFGNFSVVDSDPRQSRVLELCKEAATDFAHVPEGQWLVIWGERGSGKSHLCAAVANHLIGAGTPALFITMPDLIAALKQAMELQSNTEQETYSGRLSLFKTAPVLILDDLGAETSSPWSDGVLFEILDYRYRNRIATMIASNVAPDRFDPRIASRMQDKAFCTVLQNSANDYRKRPLSER